MRQNKDACFDALLTGLGLLLLFVLLLMMITISDLYW